MKETEAWLSSLRGRSGAGTSTVLAHDQRNPDSVAESVQIGRQLGVPANVVGASPDTFRRQAQQQRDTTALANAPLTAKWLSDLTNAGLAKDDVENLSWFERFGRMQGEGMLAQAEFLENTQVGLGVRTGVTGVKQVGTGLSALPTQGARAGALRDLQMFDAATQMDAETPLFEIAQALDLEEGSVELTLAEHFLTGDADVRKSMVDQAARRLLESDEALAGIQAAINAYSEEMQATQGRTVNFTDVDDISGFADWFAFNTGQALPFLASIFAAGAVAGPTGVGVAGYGLGVGDINASLIDEGVLDRPDIAVSGGVPYAALEFLGPAASPFRGVRSELLEQVAEGYFKRLAREIPEQAVEEFINEAGQEIIKDYAVAEGTGEEVVLNDETLLRWFNSGMAGAAGGSMFAPLSAGTKRQIERDMTAADLAGTTAAQLQEIDAMVAQSKLRQRSPEDFRAALQAQGADDASIFVPADGLREFFQAKDLQFDEAMMHEYGIEPDTFAEAEASGRDIAVPMSVYAGLISGTEDAAWFAENGVMNEGEMSVSEAARFNEEVRDVMAIAFETAEAQRRDDLEARESDVQVEDGIFTQLRSAGRTRDVAANEAKVWSAFFRTMSERYGDDALDLARRFGVQIKGPQSDTFRRRGDLDIALNTLRSKGDKALQPRGRSILQFVEDNGGIQDTGGDIEALGAPKGIIAETAAQVRERRAQPSLGGLPAEGMGRGMDEMGRAAIEAGYFPDLMGGADTNPDGTVIDEAAVLFDAIQREISGDPTYILNEGPDGDLVALSDDLARMGVDLSTATNDEAAAALERLVDGQQYDQDGRLLTDTPEFREWFGDSKAVDDEGKPLVLFHGTRADIEAFDTGKGAARFGDSAGIFLTSRRGLANEHALRGSGGKPQALEVYASLQSPVEIQTGDNDPDTYWLQNAASITDAVANADADGVILTSSSGEKMAIALDSAQVKSVNNLGTFDANDPRILHQDKRGSIIFPRGGLTEGETVINLFESADLSTFLHESGHYFLEAFTALASDEAAPQAMRDDLAAIHKFLGVETKGGATPDLLTEHHETWARGFESYLMEGKAPSLELAGAFARFKAWMTRIYRSIAGLNVKLTPEIREVMDRMLATDAEIVAAREAQQMSPLFTDQAAAGMSPAAWSTYQRLALRSAEQANQRLLEKTMAAVRRKQEKWYKSERADVRKEVSDTITSQREYRLIEMLANQQWIGGESEIPDFQIDRAQLVELFGDGVLAELGRSRLGGKRAIYGKDGSSPQEVADFFGFSDAAEMVETLQNTIKRKDAIDQETDRIMFERYGDPLNDGTIEEEALAAIHSDQQANTVAAEARHLSEKAGRSTRNLNAKAFRQRARAMLGRMTVREAIRTNSFLTAERRSAKSAEDAFAKVTKGNPAALETAAKLKEQQLLNHYLYMESRDLAAMVQSKREKMQRYSKSSVRKKLDGGYIEQIDTLLRQYDFRVRSGPQVQRAENLAKFVERMQAEGRAGELAIDQRVIDRAQSVHYTRLSVDELNGLFDTIENIDHLGRHKKSLQDAKDQRDLDEVVSGIERAFADNVKGSPPSRTPNKAESRKKDFRDYLNTVLNADTLLREIDGFKDLGSTWSALKQRVDEGMFRLVERREGMAKAFDAIYDRYSSKEKREMARKVHNEALGVEMSKWDLISLALNTGNVDNFERLTNPKVKGSFSQNGIESALTELDKRDWETVQAIWDYIDSFWGEIAAKEKRQTGIAPTKVEAQSMVVGAPGFVRGGYYPIKYDPRLSGLTDNFQQREIAEEIMGGMFAKAQTRNGHTKERGKTSRQPVMLDLAMAHNHVEQVIYDLEIGESVAASWKILQDPRIRAAFLEKGKQSDFDALEIWLMDVAAGERVAAGGMQSLMRHVRSGFTISRLAFNVSTALIQPTGLVQSAVQIGKAAVARGTVKYMSNIPRWVSDVQSVSPMMRERQKTFERDIFNVVGDLKGGPTSGWTRFQSNILMPLSFLMMQKVQFYAVDMPTWVSAYEKEIAASGDEAKARTYADTMVKRAQGSGLMSDRGMLERGTLNRNSRQQEFPRMLTALGSYMFAKGNVAYEKISGTDFKDPIQVMSLATDMVLLFTLEAVLYSAVKGYLPDEDEDKASWLLTETAFSMMSSLPLLRELSGATQGFSGGGVFGSSIEVLARPMVQAMQGDFDKALVTSTTDATGVLLHLPSSQTKAAINAIFDADMGVKRDINPLAVIGLDSGQGRSIADLVFGP